VIWLLAWEQATRKGYRGAVGVHAPYRGMHT
jgi:hypothetical protein